MNASLKSVISAAVLTLAIGGAAFAQNNVPNDTNQQKKQPDAAATENTGTMAPADTATPATTAMDNEEVVVYGVKEWSGVDASKIAVKRVNELPLETQRNKYRTLADVNKQEVERLQADVKANAALVKVLESRNVQINNIVSAHPNADGTVTFIVL